MSKILSLIMALVLSCGLIFGGVGTALAQETADPANTTLYGTVAEDGVNIGDNGVGSLAILIDGDVQSVAVTSDTKYYTCGEWHTNWEAGLVNSNDRVAVLLADSVATQVMVIPSQPVHTHLVGVVIEVNVDTIVMVDVNGNEATIKKGAALDVAAGQYVTIVAKQIPEGFSRAIAACNFEQVMNRLQSHLYGVADEEALNRVRTQLQENYDQCKTVLEELSGKFPEGSEARAQIEAATARVEEHHQATITRIDEIRTNFQEWLAQWAFTCGTITAVDVSARTVTIAPTEGEEVTLNITALTQIVKDGRFATIEDLAIDDVVWRAIYSTETMEAAVIKVHGTAWREWLAQWVSIQGTITGVDTEARAVTIAPTEGDEVTLKVTSLTRIVKNGRFVTIDDLAIDDVVREAIYSTETMEAAVIKVHGTGW